ncbi:alpha-isopropylmalate synthase regulatory domain-containing protein [Leptospira sp. GIMC2001]|uniref:alpha-isopropylmalate synthase regulatory domain-containing protein n=1 Tax=Leptospira sp. GIMC2001 TaxID=1513297 RepID=UPI00234A0895|nr:alpha-isopropylmalate synthase regulatory domain-containing protein [Leptospira sp. GIMC2001]WCL48202.1 2-isopropylmalate synthase [Leptospira sp. GIMC2001]
MINKQDKIQILDVTLRDGEQTQGVSFSSEEKLNIAKFLLQSLNVNRVEIASARTSKGETTTVQKIISWAKSENLIDRIEILGFVDGTRTIEWMNETGVKTLNLLTKGSLNHLEKQLRKTPKEHFSDIGEVIHRAKKENIKVNVYLEDWSNGFRNSPEYVMQLVEYLRSEPIQYLFLPDTLGVLSPYETHAGIDMILQKYPDLHLEFHGHNDYDLAVANCLEAVRSGAKGIHVSVNGLGERAGNSPLEAVITALHDKLDARTSIVEKEITNASRLVEVFSGKRISANRPIVGEDVFTQTAGIHADGDKKGNLYANPILPERFGRFRSYALGKLAGKASLSENLKRLGLVLSQEMEKAVLDRIIELGDQNKTVTPEDLPFIIADLSGNAENIVFKITRAKVESGVGIKPSAEITVNYKGQDFSANGKGDGGYDAFMTALREITDSLSITLPALEDYEVRIPPGGMTNALVETVITWKKSDDPIPLRTIGVDSDQQIAAMKATEKMMNLILA